MASTYSQTSWSYSIPAMVSAFVKTHVHITERGSCVSSLKHYSGRLHEVWLVDCQWEVVSVLRPKCFADRRAHGHGTRNARVVPACSTLSLPFTARQFRRTTARSSPLSMPNALEILAIKSEDDNQRPALSTAWRLLMSWAYAPVASL